MAIAALVLVGTIDVTLNGTAFAVSLVFFGIGAGLLMSQLGNVTMSSAPPEETNEAGGLQGTAQNLGASLGTALIGSVLLLGLLNGFNTRIDIPPGKRFDLCVLSPGIDPHSPMPQSFACDCPLIGEIEFGFRNAGRPVVAVTGTNGKSTTTELAARILNAGGFRTMPSGNHGRAFADVLWSGEPVDVHTLEVSSFRLETIVEFRPSVAVWLNFAPDHLDRHPGVEAYYSAKARIFENQTADDWAIVKLEDRRPPGLAARCVTFSAFAGGGDYSFDGGHIVFRDERVLDFSQTRLRGRHKSRISWLPSHWDGPSRFRGRCWRRPLAIIARPAPMRTGRRCRRSRVHQRLESHQPARARDLPARPAGSRRPHRRREGQGARFFTAVRNRAPHDHARARHRAVA